MTKTNGTQKAKEPKPVSPAEQYIKNMESSIKGYFGPDNYYHGKEGAILLAYDIGHGLAAFPAEMVNPILSSLYSRLVAVNTFGHTGGVPVNAKEWLTAVRGKADSHREWLKNEYGLG